MRVVMKVQMSGTRNGQPWPARGAAIDLPDDEAQGYIGADMAVAAGDAPAAVETATMPQDDVETRTSEPVTTKTGPTPKRSAK